MEDRQDVIRRLDHPGYVGADIFVGITIYRSHKKVVSAGPWKHPKPPHNVLAPESTFTRVNSFRINSHSPLCQLAPCVNSSPSRLVLGSIRPRVNSNPGQLEPGSTRPRVNSPRVNSSPSQLVPVSHFVPESIRPRVNSSSSQLVPGSTRDCTCPWSTCTHVNSHPSHPATESTRTQVNSHPGTCLSHYPPTYLPTNTTSHLPTYLPTSFHSFLPTDLHTYLAYTTYPSLPLSLPTYPFPTLPNFPPPPSLPPHSTTLITPSHHYLSVY